MPLCLNCLEPYDPLLHYCPKCGAAVGQLTPNIPFVNIRYQCEFWGRLWKRIWSQEPGGVFIRVFGIIMILVCVPIMLVGIPFVIIYHRRAELRGFDVLIDAEQKLAQESPPSSSPENHPDDQGPKYADRPHVKPQ